MEMRRLLPLSLCLLSACSPDEPGPAVVREQAKVQIAPRACATAIPPALAHPPLDEWPMFKRDAARTGAAPGSASFSQGQACERWAAQVSASNNPVSYDIRKGASGPLFATIGGQPMIIVVGMGARLADGTWDLDAPSRVYFFDAASGALVRPPTVLQGTDDQGEVAVGKSAIYAPLLVDVDGQGKRELIVTSNGSRWVFAVRTEDEGTSPAGSIRWIFRIDDGDATSETGPNAVDLDCDGVPDIVFGTGNGSSTVGAAFYALNGRTGRPIATPFRTQLRSQRDPDCVIDFNGSTVYVNKIDSSSPTVALDQAGIPTVFVGAWDGNFYGLQLSPPGGAGPLATLVASYRDDLFTGDTTTTCDVPKVRSTAVLGNITGASDLELAYGYMYEYANDATDWTTAHLRVVRLGHGRIRVVNDFPEIDDWKSSPALGDLRVGGAPDIGIAGGRFKGVYRLRRAGSHSMQVAWSFDIGDGAGAPTTNAGGNRSSPTIFNSDGDAAGTNEIVIGIEGEQTPGIIAYDGSGQVKWQWPAAGAPRPPEFFGNPGQTAVGSIGGRLGMAFAGWDGYLRVLDSETLGGGCRTTVDFP